MVAATNRELPISHAVINWLSTTGWPLVFPEVPILRGFIRGRVDVAAVSKGFRKSVAAEVKIAYKPGDPEGQLFDARRAAEFVYLAAPADVIRSTTIPTPIGILEARSDGVGPRPMLTVVREAKRGKPEFGICKEFLHALMRSAMRTGRFDASWAIGKVCPAGSSGGCPFRGRA